MGLSSSGCKSGNYTYNPLMRVMVLLSKSHDPPSRTAASSVRNYVPGISDLHTACASGNRHIVITYLWLVGNGGMGYDYNYYYYHSSIPY